MSGANAQQCTSRKANEDSGGPLCDCLRGNRCRDSGGLV
eukprot:CAMPEP_0183444800 /NCGR_PEP_ID=MMETSP0370-20130417/95926_1 /TAXON_ID=268820 /ORGANISM="Peridinium aciculiferum, Strain PAER-2" /LENGTH=38 /DNA_ID= /DNA_START= /DNA_END= /DNA_ORIENTATION=